jgi:subtilisin family serine protease
MIASESKTCVVILALVAGISGCNRHKNPKATAGGHEQTAEESGEIALPTTGSVVIKAGNLPELKDNSQRLFLPNGGFINIVNQNGVPYVPVEGTMDAAAFQKTYAAMSSVANTPEELTVRLSAPLNSATSILASQVGLTDIVEYPKVQYFKGLMPYSRYAELAAIKGLPGNFVMTAVVSFDSKSIVETMDAELLTELAADPRMTTESFSGLKRMGVPEFEEIIKNEINLTPDGSDVKVGVADTGITMNHPAFEGENGVSRVKYLRDFTTEGRAYINPSARFEITIPTGAQIPAGANPAELLLLTAEILPPQIGAGVVPSADALLLRENLQLLVGTELRALLTAPNSGVKLGFISEKSYDSDNEHVDLNMNGKLDDNLALLLVGTPTGYQVYFDKSGEMDFRQSVAVGDFNKTADTIKIVSEKIGFDIRPLKLRASTGEAVSIIGVSIVGYDAGNHGSHVTGIIAGKKTIQNDRDTTLARGSAPKAELMVNRVCANNGGCTSNEAIIDLALSGAEIINMSLGGLSESNDEYSVDALLIDRLTAVENTLFIISAGNSGPGNNTVGSPSTARLALSVGATASNALVERQYQWPGTGQLGPKTGNVDRNKDFMLMFSSRGPSASGGFKPNITAPGTELSSVQLNAALGARAGLDVYWGTSMAAPAATGAIALLLDAAKKYNKTATSPLPTDALTLRKVILASAKPFDVNSWNPQTGESTQGQYTWIDQGLGMINLPRAWQALKDERASKITSAVYYEEAGSKVAVEVEYLPRVLAINPNGLDYTGAVPVNPQDATLGNRLGSGIWLDMKGTQTLFPVQIARRLPVSAAGNSHYGDLRRLLVTTADEFKLETVIYGSKKEWIRAGTLTQPNCTGAATSNLTVIGEGATDTATGSTGPLDSSLNVCIDRAALAALPAGDHGALIKAYKVSNGTAEVNPSFVVPVYISVPHHTLAGIAAYEKAGVVQSFGISRNYVVIPEGTNLVKVTIEIPASVTECQGVRAYILEAGNTKAPAEFTSGKDKALNCSITGIPAPETRVLSYVRNHPKAGIWNVHVFGMYQYPESQFKLRVDFAKVAVSQDSITGEPAALNGTLTYSILESSTDAKPDATNSKISLSGLATESVLSIEQDAQISPANPEGKVFRQYSADIASVTMLTGKSDGNDIDLNVMECTSEAAETCIAAGSSGSATADEKVTFTPDPTKFYMPVVIGYGVLGGRADFMFGERLDVKTPDLGKLTITGSDATFVITHSMDIEAAQLLHDPRFLSGKYTVAGQLALKTSSGAELTSIPVWITKAPN